MAATDTNHNSETTSFTIKSSGNTTVDRMASFQILGNVIPKSWYKTIVKTSEGGKCKPYPLAISLLSEIVYWYRPTEYRDEQSGMVVGLKRKFKADLLQMDISKLCETFGEEERSIRRALSFLEELGVIYREVRTIRLTNGFIRHNVLFIGLDIDVLARLTYPVIEKEEETEAEVLSSDPVISSTEEKMEDTAASNPVKSDKVTLSNLTGLPGQICQDYPDKSVSPSTKNISPEITGTEINSSHNLTGASRKDNNQSINPSEGRIDRSNSSWKDYDQVVQVIKENIKYDSIVAWNDIYDRKLEKKTIELWEYDAKYVQMNIVDRIIRYMADAYCANRDIEVCNSPVSAEVLKTRIMKIDNEQFLEAYRTLKDKYKEVSNKRDYTLSVLFNG